MIIRHYRSGDEEALVELFQALNIHENSICSNRRTDRQGGIDSLRAALDRVRDTAGLALVAEKDGQVIGYLFTEIAEDAQFVREELRAHAHISEFFVRESARGSGVGRALFAQAQQFTAEKGLKRLSVSVLSGNLAALGAYERFGFAPYSIDLTMEV